MLTIFNNTEMQKNAAAFTTICMLLCFAFNYTFPLHRQTKSANYAFGNSTHYWEDFLNNGFIHERNKKMAGDIEEVYRKIKKSAQELIKPHEKESKSDVDKNINNLSDEDLRHYEQLVIMKKYPYLDLKDLESNYRPLTSKNTRQSLGLQADVNFRSDIGSLDTEEELNVEIINRGLTGFSIPPTLAKGVAMAEDKLKLSLNDETEAKNFVKKKSSKREALLGGLEKYIIDYEQKKFKNFN